MIKEEDRQLAVEDQSFVVHGLEGKCYQRAHPNRQSAEGLALGRNGVVGVENKRYTQKAMKHAKTDSHKIVQDVLVALHQ